MLRLDLLKTITDIEDLLYVTTGGKSKKEWPEDVTYAFNRIKHRILDKAGDISRLPETLHVENEKHTDPLGDFIASVFRNGKNGDKEE